MSPEKQDDNPRKADRGHYCQGCGACSAGQKTESENAATPGDLNLESLVSRITREVLKVLGQS